MVTFAIDPGPVESAYAVYDGERMRGGAKLPNHELILGLPAVIRSDDQVAIEMVASYGMAVGREVFETCVWIGRFMQAMPDPEKVRLVYRRDVKIHLCGSMKAKDGNVRQALIDKLGPPGTKKNPGPTYGCSGDIWQALGVAVTAAETTPLTP